MCVNVRARVCVCVLIGLTQQLARIGLHRHDDTATIQEGGTTPTNLAKLIDSWHPKRSFWYRRGAPWSPLPSPSCARKITLVLLLIMNDGFSCNPSITCSKWFRVPWLKLRCIACDRRQNLKTKFAQVPEHIQLTYSTYLVAAGQGTFHIDLSAVGPNFLFDTGGGLLDRFRFHRVAQG